MNENASDSSPLHETLQVVSFMAGGYRFAVEAAWVRAQRLATEADAAINVEKLLGLPEDKISDSATWRILIIKQAITDYPIRVTEPVTLCYLSLSELHPLPDMLAARNTLNGIRALSTENEGVTVLIDFGFVNQEAVGSIINTAAD